MNTSVHSGWYLLALEDDLSSDLTPIRVGARRLMLVRDGDGLRLTDATCPHRGADLARAGVLDHGCVVCPFHGRRIHLGSGGRHTVAEHSVLRIGPLVLGRLGIGEADDRGATDQLPRLLAGLSIVSAVDAQVAAAPELVIENAFDPEHFATVHRVPEVRGMTAHRAPSGALVIGGDFFTVLDPWADATTRARVQLALGPGAGRHPGQGSGFIATAYSPTLVVTRFGSGDAAPVIITGALPDDHGGSHVRVVVAGSAPLATLERVAEGSRKAIVEDIEVWDHLDPDHVDQLDEQDAPVLAFQDFCRSFAAVTSSAGRVPPVSEAG